MERNNIQLTDKKVGEIEGTFVIPSYQRGYRWDELQVRALLNDIYQSGGKPYCLQPLVVRRDEHGRYEVIDGQQRLTTIYIIYKYMVNRWPDYFDSVKYTIEYATRKGNVDFFNDIENENLANSNIDFYHIHKAYKSIKCWFDERIEKKPIHVAGELSKYFDISVKVIWYELQASSTDEEANKLFTRLNIGRIPLTNAELVKALFLSRQQTEKHGEAEKQRYRQMEIAFQWDIIERELHDEDFWYFLTTKSTSSYPTRIELLFDFMAKKRDDELNPFFTFDYFRERRYDLEELWQEISQYYYRLKEWFKNDDLYHKIGYLVSSGHTTIDRLVNETENLKKSEIVAFLDEEIKASINFKRPYSELNYERSYDQIKRVLLLFNVVSLMKNKGKTRFPFKEFNTNHWSLEHIHAQHSLKLNTKEKWKRWLEDHLESVSAMADIDENRTLAEDLLNNITTALANEHLTKEEFSALEGRVKDLLSEKGDTEYVHSLSNMALLERGDNSVLSNGLFDAKRRQIIKMEETGRYIPYCTKMVFLKYYTASGTRVNFYFWTRADRKAYIKKINEILVDYRKEEFCDDSNQSN